MFYMLFFAAGYWIGSGGKIALQPGITQGADGSYVIGPPQQNPQTQPYMPPQAQNGSQLPPGYSIDPQGNVFDAAGRLYATAQQWADAQITYYQPQAR
jgi:hypothetical protein